MGHLEGKGPQNKQNQRTKQKGDKGLEQIEINMKESMKVARHRKQGRGVCSQRGGILPPDSEMVIIKYLGGKANSGWEILDSFSVKYAELR